MTKLEADRDMELEERQKLEEEIRAKQEEIERLQNISTPNFSTLKFSTPSSSTLIFKTLFKSEYNSKLREPFVQSISEFKFLCHTALLFCEQSKAVNLTHYVWVHKFRQVHIDGFTTCWLSMRIKLVTFIEIALHCIAMTAIFTQNDHFFKSDQIDWKRLICSAFNQNGQVWKKWSFWVKIVVIAMQCISNEGD